MRIAIVGGGSLGLLWGTRLAETEHETVLFTRTKEQQHLLQQQGLIYTSLQKMVTTRSITSRWIQETEGISPFDLVIVTVKQFHLASVIPFLQRITYLDSSLIFWQNGLGHDEQIARLHQRAWTYAAVTTEGAWKRSANEVVHTGRGETWVGRFPVYESVPPAWLAALPQEIHYDPQIKRRMWEKLAINCVINPLTALYQVRNGELLSDTYHEQMSALLREMIAVANQEGVYFTFDDLWHKVITVCTNTAQNYSSMLQDRQRGTRTEIDAINGIVVKLGEKYHVPTPNHLHLIHQLRERGESTN